MKVEADIGGSNVVVWINPSLYIDARKDIRYPGVSFIEVVRNGHVVQDKTAIEKDAPETIIELMKEWA